MDEFKKKIDLAKKKLLVADHMLTRTYQLLKDSKLLLAVLENIFSSFAGALSGFLAHQRAFKRIPIYTKNFESEFNLYKLKVQQKYDLDPKFSKCIDKIKDTLIKHKKSPVEFTRNDNFVICSDTYNLTSISVEDLKEDIKTCSEFIKLLEQKMVI